MALSVSERGEAVATFRYIEVELMETLARWTPTSPEMEAKLMFGEHIWDVAQNADALGKRAHELRLPLHHSLKPVDPYAELLSEISAEQETPRRLAGLYDALLPGLAARYEAYLAAVDQLMDAPTVRIVEGILRSQAKMIEQCNALRAELPELRGDHSAWLESLTQRDSGIEKLVA